MKTSQMMNSEIARLSLNMLMIGQLKKRTPRTNKNIQTSLLMVFPPSLFPLVRARIRRSKETAIPPGWSGRIVYRKSLS